MQNIKYLLWSLIFTVLLSIPSFAIVTDTAGTPVQWRVRYYNDAGHYRQHLYGPILK